jgi:hypothetical protein
VIERSGNLLRRPGREEDMNVEGLACYIIGARQVCVPVVFTEEHPEATNGMPVALVRGCSVARNQLELTRMAIRPGEAGPDPVGVRLYVKPDTTDSEMCCLCLAGFQPRRVRLTDVFSVAGWWHLAAHRHHLAETRAVRRPPGKSA